MCTGGARWKYRAPLFEFEVNCCARRRTARVLHARKDEVAASASAGAGDAPAPKASGWLSAKRELRSSRKGLRAASEECGFAGVRGAMHATSDTNRGMAGYVRYIVLGVKRKTA